MNTLSPVGGAAREGLWRKCDLWGQALRFQKPYTRPSSLSCFPAFGSRWELSAC